MSTSTVSITAANAAATRRRTSVVSEKEKKSSLDVAGTEVAPATGKFVGSGGDMGMDLGHSIRGETVLEKSGRKVGTGNGSSVAVSAGAVPRKSKKKAEKPLWLWLISVLTKNAIVVMLMVLLFQAIRHYAVNRGVAVFPSGDHEGRIAEMQSLLKKTVQMLQFQLDVAGQRLDSEIAGLGKRIEDHGAEVASQLHKLEERVASVEKSTQGEWVPRDEFDKFLEEYKKAKGVDEHGQVNLDEVASFAREIVQKEIEKHAADGLGMVDYALGSGGGWVVEHSMPLYSAGWFGNRRVHRDAGKMLRPSLGEPGECFPLKGSSGFVQIALRSPIIPEAVTLEHVAKSVAYDRSSAPKDCRVSGWFQNYDTPGSAVDSENKHLLTEFTYDLEKSNAQTFSLLESASSVVNTIRLDFTSNHGHDAHTCIYRLRVHGQPESVPTLAVKS